MYFDFTRLITKYSSEFTAITLGAGYYDESGFWQKAQVEKVTLQGAIISYSDSKVYRSEGALTAKDKRLFSLVPLDDKLHGAKIVYENDVYSMEDCSQNAKFTGVYEYTLKHISAFKETTAGHDITEELEKLEQRLDGVLEETEETTKPETELSSDDVSKFEKRLDGVLNG